MRGVRNIVLLGAAGGAIAWYMREYRWWLSTTWELMTELREVRNSCQRLVAVTERLDTRLTQVQDTLAAKATAAPAGVASAPHPAQVRQPAPAESATMVEAEAPSENGAMALKPRTRRTRKSAGDTAGA